MLWGGFASKGAGDMSRVTGWLYWARNQQTNKQKIRTVLEQTSVRGQTILDWGWSSLDETLSTNVCPGIFTYLNVSSAEITYGGNFSQLLVLIRLSLQLNSSCSFVYLLSGFHPPASRCPADDTASNWHTETPQQVTLSAASSCAEAYWNTSWQHVWVLRSSLLLRVWVNSSEMPLWSWGRENRAN